MPNAAAITLDQLTDLPALLETTESFEALLAALRQGRSSVIDSAWYLPPVGLSDCVVLPELYCPSGWPRRGGNSPVAAYQWVDSRLLVPTKHVADLLGNPRGGPGEPPAASTATS